MKNTNQEPIHLPVLLTAVLEYLDPKAGENLLDLTAGFGGHAKAILERTKQPSQTVLVDRDKTAIDHLTEQFPGPGPIIIHQDFEQASRDLASAARKFDLILADLGVSSLHFDESSRGFSLKTDGPLDMRMDVRQSLTANEIVNNYDFDDLVSIFRRYGEEPRANKIARLIVEHRPITSTSKLAQIVAKAYPSGSRVHPATRTFQALRVEVNNELAQLEHSLPIWIDLLRPGGRIAVISFHSLEDRLVKQYFKELSEYPYDAVIQLITKQPITATTQEIVYNPRSRSAKLRAAAKIKNKK